MKKALIIFTLILTTFVSANYAQKNVEPQIQRDPILEADAKHNLDVSWYHFKLKKAYIAVLLRFEETFAAHPDFSQMDEFLYLAAMSSKNLADGKGEQKIILSKLPEIERKKYEPAKLREDAVAYFSLIKDKYPQSKYIGETEKTTEIIAKEMNLNQVTIYSDKPTESIEFYKKLGLLLIVDSAPRYVRFECPDGNSTLSIAYQENISPVSNITLYFECKNLDEEVKRLQNLGFLTKSQRIKFIYGERHI